MFYFSEKRRSVLKAIRACLLCNGKWLQCARTQEEPANICVKIRLSQRVLWITAAAIQWFSHGIFVLPPHFLRHRAVWLPHVPKMARWVKLGPTYTPVGAFLFPQTV
jgi:hypothetical protein